MSSPFTTYVKLIDGATATVTDPVASLGTNTYDVSQRQKLSLQFVSSDITSGNGVFNVYVSNDGVNWVKYNRLTDNLTNTNAQNDTRVASVTLSSNTNEIYFFPIGDTFRFIGVSCAITTDGTYSAILAAQ